jgi:PucR family transcriptional regulator, purine catabolism regulatory protein
VNLFEVPRQTAFVAVSRATARLLEEHEEAAARAALEMQRQLTMAAARPAATEAVLERLARLLDGAACTMTADGQLGLGPFGPAQAGLMVEEIGAEVQRIRPQGLRAASTIAGTASTLIHPLGLQGRPSSYLAVLVPGRPTDGQRNAVTTAVALLGLIAEQERDRLATRRSLRTRAMELLAGGDVRSAKLVLGTVTGSAELPNRVQVLRAVGAEEVIEDALRWLEEIGLAATLDDELCAVASPGRSARFAADLAATGLRVGVGEAVPLSDVTSSFATAGHALSQTAPGVPVLQWERIVGEGALALIDRERAEAFASSFLGPLDDDLVETLASFLRHHGSRLKVAEELGVHRNTVRNRVAQIEAALGRSLDDPQVRVSVWVALQSRPTGS